jgi:Uma2 family endonuclease
MLAETKLITAEEFYLIQPKNERSVLLSGRIYHHPFLAMEQGECVASIASHIAQFVEQSNAGRTYVATGFVLARNPDTVRAPSFAFVSKSRIAQGTNRGFFFEGAPDLAIEIQSQSDSIGVIWNTLQDYFEAETRMVLYLDPYRKEIGVYDSLEKIRVLTMQDILDGGEVLPGLKIPVRDIFSDDG